MDTIVDKFIEDLKAMPVDNACRLPCTNGAMIQLQKIELTDADTIEMFYFENKTDRRPSQKTVTDLESIELVLKMAARKAD